MIYLNETQAEAFYGKPQAATPRFNATVAKQYITDGYKIHLGYLGGYCIYAIMRKRSASRISIAERTAILTRSSKSEWKVIEGAEGTINKPLSLQATPPKEEIKFPSPLFATHHLQRGQLVIFHPHWHVDLSMVEQNPI